MLEKTKRFLTKTLRAVGIDDDGQAVNLMALMALPDLLKMAGPGAVKRVLLDLMTDPELQAQVSAKRSLLVAVHKELAGVPNEPPSLDAAALHAILTPALLPPASWKAEDHVAFGATRARALLSEMREHRIVTGSVKQARELFKSLRHELNPDLCLGCPLRQGRKPDQAAICGSFEVTTEGPDSKPRLRASCPRAKLSPPRSLNRIQDPELHGQLLSKGTANVIGTLARKLERHEAIPTFRSWALAQSMLELECLNLVYLSGQARSCKNCALHRRVNLRAAAWTRAENGRWIPPWTTYVGYCSLFQEVKDDRYQGEKARWIVRLPPEKQTGNPTPPGSRCEEWKPRKKTEVLIGDQTRALGDRAPADDEWATVRALKYGEVDGDNPDPLLANRIRRLLDLDENCESFVLDDSLQILFRSGGDQADPGDVFPRPVLDQIRDGASRGRHVWEKDGVLHVIDFERVALPHITVSVWWKRVAAA